MNDDSSGLSCHFEKGGTQGPNEWKMGSMRLPLPNTGTSRVLKRHQAMGEPVLLSEARFNKQNLGPLGGHACLEAPEVSSSVPDFLLYLSWQGSRSNPPSQGRSTGQE